MLKNMGVINYMNPILTVNLAVGSDKGVAPPLSEPMLPYYQLDPKEHT